MAVKGGSGDPVAVTKKGGDDASGSIGTGRGGDNNGRGGQSASEKSAGKIEEDIIKTPPD